MNKAIIRLLKTKMDTKYRIFTESLVKPDLGYISNYKIKVMLDILDSADTLDFIAIDRAIDLSIDNLKIGIKNEHIIPIDENLLNAISIVKYSYNYAIQDAGVATVHQLTKPIFNLDTNISTIDTTCRIVKLMGISCSISEVNTVISKDIQKFTEVYLNNFDNRYNPVSSKTVESGEHFTTKDTAIFSKNIDIINKLNIKNNG